VPASLPVSPSGLPCQPARPLNLNTALTITVWVVLPSRPLFQHTALVPLLPADYMQEMRQSLEHLALLPPSAALSLLLAVWPMCRCALHRAAACCVLDACWALLPACLPCLHRGVCRL
jgi:hypothetical protein